MQKTLAAIWEAVLGLDRVGLEDNFFELGGDSIISIQVVSRARQAGIRISPRDLFRTRPCAVWRWSRATIICPRWIRAR